VAGPATELQGVGATGQRRSLLIEEATDAPWYARRVRGGLKLAQRRIEALARREHQAAGKGPTASRRANRATRRRLQLQDAQDMVVERVLLDLEQLVARIGIEDRQQRLAIVAVGVEAERRRILSTRPRSTARRAPGHDKRPT
jgi:hypothetical protein